MNKKKVVEKLIMPEGFESNIVERPHYVDKMVGRGENKTRILKLCEAVKALPAGHSLAFRVPDFEDKFGPYKKQKLQTMKLSMKNFGVEHPRIVFDNGVIHIWENRDA